MDQEKGRKAIRFVEALFEFLADPTDLTESELDELLKEEGIDADAAVSKVLEWIRTQETKED